MFEMASYKARRIIGRIVNAKEKYVPTLEDAYQQRFRELIRGKHIYPGGNSYWKDHHHRAFFRLGDYLSFLSFGQSDFDDTVVKRLYAANTFSDCPIEELEQALQEAVDLTEIWTSSMGFSSGLFLLVDEKSGLISDSLAEDSAKERALEVVVEGYYDGIPVQDLVA